MLGSTLTSLKLSNPILTEMNKRAGETECLKSEELLRTDRNKIGTEGQPMDDARKLTGAQIKAIEKTLSKGDRVEIIPQRDGLKLVHIRREELK